MRLIAELSKDNVDALRKAVEGRVQKLETVKSSQKPGWGLEAEKLISGGLKSSWGSRLIAANDTDNATITNLLARRVFVKACMWHELAVVHHSRQASQATLGWRALVNHEVESVKALTGIWDDLQERLQVMPLE